ncbi:MAG: hypothetical protein M1835_003628 [Candelina submexicana]|nr:MAG: hypothetical protein M1835_003628 [Candelina submexicana]
MTTTGEDKIGSLIQLHACTKEGFENLAHLILETAENESSTQPGLDNFDKLSLERKGAIEIPNIIRRDDGSFELKKGDNRYKPQIGDKLEFKVGGIQTEAALPDLSLNTEYFLPSALDESRLESYSYTVEDNEDELAPAISKVIMSMSVGQKVLIEEWIDNEILHV